MNRAEYWEGPEITATEYRKRMRWLIQHGFRPADRGMGKKHYQFNRAGCKWRINRFGMIQRSCPHAEFDRWANSTEDTYTFDDFKSLWLGVVRAVKMMEGV